jgi:ABC-type antimicrobial peptide transport system permease subunit
VQAIETTFAKNRPQPAFTYLANTIADGERSIPYSTITAIDFSDAPPLGPWHTPEGESISPLGDNEIALNTWATDDLDAKPGDEITVTYFEPESTHGQVLERTATFRLKAIVALEGAAADPELTPPLAGVTDRLTIGDWDAPFPFEASRVRKKDEDYWDQHRTTPKAFVSLATGRRLWGSRFGDTTAVRIAPPEGTTVESLAAQLQLDAPALGFEFQPIKRLGLQASSGTTPFGLLFLGFSFFIIASALMLVALLYQLGVEQRASEIGTLTAVGLRRRDIGQLLAFEGALVATLGSWLGVVAGVGYAWLMLAGLRTWWLGAISTPFLQLHVRSTSLFIGCVSGIVASVLAILWTLRRMGRVPARRLLAGQATRDRWLERQPPIWWRRGAWFAIGLAIGAGFKGAQLQGAAQAAAFFIAGALVLIGSLVLAWSALRAPPVMTVIRSGRFSLIRLAARNGARNPTRSALMLGLVASATFLIVALSAFRLDPKDEIVGNRNGSGGYALIAESDQPVHQDLNEPAALAELPFDAQARRRLAECFIAPLRVQSGDDASCLNLYQARQPRILGVPPRMIDHGGFSWAASEADTPEARTNPWLLLERPAWAEEQDTPVPVVLDFNTATYGLHAGLGDVLSLRDGRGRPLQVRIVGLLRNSILQGDVMMSESQFLRHFPDVNGYRMFLIDAPREAAATIQRDLEHSLGDYGFAAEPTARRLERFFAVQNTYLSTFQSLGGLGLLLGTFGLATAQLRGVMERRGELALMRAAGFRRARLAMLVLIENALLLLGGLALGCFAALVALAPSLIAEDASIPWRSLAGTLAAVLIFGLAAGLIAVRATSRAELLPALRGE